MKSILKIISAFFISVVILVLIIDISIVVQAKNNANKTPNILGFKAFIVLSNSMQPEFSQGDLVIVKMVNANSLDKNDIISFKNKQGTIITHRIIDVSVNDGKIGFITKGDRNNEQDDIVYPENIEGKLICKIENGGNTINIIKDPKFFPILIAIIFVLGALIYLLSKDGSEKPQNKSKGKRFK